MEPILEEAPKVFDTRLSGIAEKLKQQAAQAEPIQQETPVQPSEIAPQPVASQEQSKKEEPKVEQVKEETPEPADEWDDQPTATQPAETKVDFEKIGSALKLEGIKGESDLVAKFNELNTELAQYKEKATTFSQIPDDLKPVLEIAAKGGDWKTYVNPVDYSKVDPVDAYEYELSKLPQFRNPDGTFNKQSFDDAMDAIPETQKSLEGSRILRQLSFEQNQRISQQQQTIQARKESQDRDLAEAAKQLPNLFPVEQYGIKFDQRHSETLYKGISDGSLLQKHFLRSDGSYDMKKVMSTIAKAEYAEKMLKHVSNKATVQTKKQILKETTNPQFTTTSTSAAPTQVDEKPLSPAEKFAKFAQSQTGLK